MSDMAIYRELALRVIVHWRAIELSLPNSSAVVLAVVCGRRISRPHRSRRGADPDGNFGTSAEASFCPERDGFSAGLAPVSAPSPNAARRSAIVHFGIFEADVETHELRKHGRR